MYDDLCVMQELLKSQLGRLRVLGFVEGVSFLLILFVTMPLKYYFDQPQPNKVIGMAHGVLFIGYCYLVVAVGFDKGWNWKVIGLGLLASIIPFGTFWADWKFFRE
jgi:integral membrane protein